MTEPEPLQQVCRTCVRFRQRQLSYFSGCDYFRLASDARRWRKFKWPAFGETGFDRLRNDGKLVFGGQRRSWSGEAEQPRT